MKKLKQIGTKLLGIVLMLGVCQVNPVVTSANSVTKTVSQQYVEAMNPGWNLGNTFDSFDTGGDKGEESWGNPVVTKELIKKIKEEGFNSIRIPFTSVMRTGEAPEYTIDKKFLDRYAEVVNWALEEDLYVMINLHHDSWNWAGAIGADWDNGTSMERYKAIWTQLADYFKEYSNKVCFESMNEPQFWSGDITMQLNINDQVNEAFYKIVRESGGNNKTRMLVLPTLNTNDSQDKCDALYKSIKAFSDENIIATFHYYGYWPFSVNIAGQTKFDDKVISELEDAFDRVYSTFTQNGIGVICGEYGLLGFDTSLDAVEHGKILKYFEYINYYAKEKKMTLMLWDNGQHLNRHTYNWSDPSLYHMINTSQVTRSAYSQSDRIFVNERIKGKNIKLNLTLNGHFLKSIYDENRELIPNKDYSYDDGVITLYGAYIIRNLNKNHGINQTLTLKFNEGEDWKVYLTYYDLPTLETAEGTTTAFIFPIDFKGSRIATLEATYTDGTSAGPQNWTTFKEFAYTFAPNYEDNTMVIKDKFFEEAKEGKIMLKIHLQSGEILRYNLTKSGDKVIGIPA